MIFVEEQKHVVQLVHDELGTFDGELSFGGGKSVSASLKLMGSMPQVASGSSLGVMRAKGENGQSFTLFDCVFYGFHIYAEFIIVGDFREKEFVRFNVRYSEVSEWFLDQHQIKGTVGESLLWENLPPAVSASVRDGDKEFSIKTEYCGELSQSGENCVLSQYIEFSLSCTKGVLSVENVRRKSLELACLLSILLAFPVSIVDIDVAGSNGRRYRAYFPTFKQAERNRRDNDFARSCFIQRAALDGYWQKVLENFFKSSYRRLWVHFAGMQRYNDFWEYRVLGYVSLLDHYVGKRGKGAKKSLREPSSEMLVSFKKELGHLSPLLDQDVVACIADIAKRSFTIEKSADFKGKYRYVMEESDADIIKIINISPEDFDLIGNTPVFNGAQKYR